MKKENLIVENMKNHLINNPEKKKELLFSVVAEVSLVYSLVVSNYKFKSKIQQKQKLMRFMS